MEEESGNPVIVVDIKKRSVKQICQHTMVLMRSRFISQFTIAAEGFQNIIGLEKVVAGLQRWITVTQVLAPIRNKLGVPYLVVKFDRISEFSQSFL